MTDGKPPSDPNFAAMEAVRPATPYDDEAPWLKHIAEEIVWFGPGKGTITVPAA